MCVYTHTCNVMFILTCHVIAPPIGRRTWEVFCTFCSLGCRVFKLPKCVFCPSLFLFSKPGGTEAEQRQRNMMRVMRSAVTSAARFRLLSHHHYYHATTTILHERTKPEVLEDIMTWRTKFLDAQGHNPSQDDITADESGNALIEEWQALEEQEEVMEGDVMGLDPVSLQLKENIQEKLARWKTDYETAHGRKPNRHDLINDKYSADLFQQFQNITTMEWPADMRLLLTTKIEKPHDK